jgi:Na+(H+)/acetate symporter ActP
MNTNMNAEMQETIALSIVALVVARMLWRFFREELADPIAKRLLRQGRVKWAMRLHSLTKK